MKSYIVTFAFLASLTLANPITQAPAMMPRADGPEGEQVEKRACNSRVGDDCGGKYGGCCAGLTCYVGLVPIPRCHVHQKLTLFSRLPLFLYMENARGAKRGLAR